MSVVIVGGGLMGLSAAFHLRRADPSLPVTVLERAPVGSAASGASPAGVRVMGRDPAKRRLALESLGRWPGLDRELEGATGYRLEESVGVKRLVFDCGRVVGIERGDGARQPCDVAILTAGAWTSTLLAGLGVKPPLQTRWCLS